jgi:hypothetical protein
VFRYGRTAGIVTHRKHGISGIRRAGNATRPDRLWTLPNGWSGISGMKRALLMATQNVQPCGNGQRRARPVRE